MKKVMFAHSVSVVGGAERVSESIATTLNTAEFSASLLCAGAGALAECFNEQGIPVVYVDFFQPSLRHPLKTLRHILSIKTLLRKHNVDILHVGDPLAFRSLWYAAKQLNIPVVCHVHFPYEPSFIEWTFKRSYSPAAFVYCSEELKDNVSEQIAKVCPTSKHIVIHNGVDTTRFSPHQKKIDGLTHIGIVANLQRRKGHDEFIQMAARIAEVFPNVRFHIIGGDILQEPRQPALETFVKTLGIADVVTFHGQVKNVLPLLRLLDIYVCCSHEEAFPISILEAMACQKTIVSTNVNGIPEALSDRENALLIPPKDVNALVDAVSYCLQNPEFAARMGQNARTHVVDNFSMPVFAERFKQLYLSL